MRSRRRVSRPSHNGFTLIELLLVMVILGVLAAIVVPKYVGRSKQSKIDATKASISNIASQLDVFETENGRFPTTEEGLNALVEKPSAEMPDWKQLLDKKPEDPWGHPFIYRCPGTNGKNYDVVSCGPDGQEGTEDDISN